MILSYAELDVQGGLVARSSAFCRCPSHLLFGILEPRHRRYRSPRSPVLTSDQRYGFLHGSCPLAERFEFFRRMRWSAFLLLVPTREPDAAEFSSGRNVQCFAVCRSPARRQKKMLARIVQSCRYARSGAHNPPHPRAGG